MQEIEPIYSYDRRNWSLIIDRDLNAETPEYEAGSRCSVINESF